MLVHLHKESRTCIFIKADFPPAELQQQHFAHDDIISQFLFAKA